MDNDASAEPPLLAPESQALPPPNPPFDWQSILRNRLILGGMGALTLLLLIAIVLVAIGGGEDDRAQIGAQPTANGDGSTPVLSRGVTGEMRTTATIRNGPGPTFAILGTIPRETVVSVVGRNEDSTWLQVLYPPGSQLRGWVLAASINVRGDVDGLVVAGPGLQPIVPVPTSFEPFVEPTFVIPDEPDTPQPTLTPRPTFTPRPINTRAPTSTPLPTQTPPAVPTSDGTFDRLEGPEPSSLVD